MCASPAQAKLMANEKKLVVVHRLHQILVPFMLRRQVGLLHRHARLASFAVLVSRRLQPPPVFPPGCLVECAQGLLPGEHMWSLTGYCPSALTRTQCTQAVVVFKIPVMHVHASQDACPRFMSMPAKIPVMHVHASPWMQSTSHQGQQARCLQRGTLL